MQIALPPAVYAHAEQDDLRDLRIVDARGERAPFALLAPRSTLHTSQQVREATLYPLPAKPSAAGDWASPVDVVVEGDRISVHRHGPAAAATPRAPRESGGWLVDSGETRAGEPAPQSLTLRWSGPAEFSAAYRLESSDDLRQWRPAGTGQVMALQSAAGSLTQPIVPLPEATGRFLRLVWAEPADAPVLTGASVLVAERHLVALDSARELRVAPSAEPAGRIAADAASRRALHFDLGGALPLIDVDLRFASGTHVAPVRLQGRSRIDEPGAISAPASSIDSSAAATSAGAGDRVAGDGALHAPGARRACRPLDAGGALAGRARVAGVAGFRGPGRAAVSVALGLASTRPRAPCRWRRWCRSSMPSARASAAPSSARSSPTRPWSARPSGRSSRRTGVRCCSGPC